MTTSTWPDASSSPRPTAGGGDDRPALASGVVDHDARLLATAVASLAASDRSARFEAPSELATVLSAIEDPEARLVAWARRHPAAPEVLAWCSRLRRIRAVVVLLAIALTLLLGWLAAQAALGLDRSRPTNVYWLLGGVLLPQTFLLLAWVGITLFGGVGAMAVTVGGLLRGMVVRLLAGRLGGQPVGTAVLAAWARLGSSGAVARWSIGLATNLLWASFNAGTLAAVVALLAVQQHTFCWESTIFSAEGYRRITEAVARLPSALGFPTPDAGQIAAARLDPSNPAAFPSQDEAGRVAWSGLLVGSVVAYGLLPRAALAVISGLALARARRRVRLDLDSPLLAPIAAGLTASARRGVGQADVAWPSSVPPEQSAERDVATERIPRSGSRPAIVAIELAVPTCGWPPAPLTGVDVVDLGRLESREDRRSALTALTAMAPPRSLTIFASLTTTPDRGVAALLRELGAAARRSPALVLTGGGAMRGRGDAGRVAQRVEDWRTVASEAGVPMERVREIDLDLLTAATAASLRGLVLDGAGDVSPDRRIERAARLIAEAADRWLDRREPPSIAAQAALHRAIAELHGASRERSSWAAIASGRASELARAATSAAASPGELAEVLARAGEQVTALLPPGLRVRPRWIAAGALAGALGCVVAAFAGPAGLAVPLAVQGLPVWSGIGAAVGAAFSTGRRAGPAQHEAQAASPEESMGEAWATAVRAATIQALVLELQGGGEARLSRLLEQVLPEPDPQEHLLLRPAPGSAGRWLDGVRHRLDLGLGSAPRVAEAAS